MSLNTYRDEAGQFLDAIHASAEPIEKKVLLLQHELDILKANLHDAKTISHQVYDLLFLLFEIASVYNANLDVEWLAGQSRKQKKYLLPH
jgi:hypothetical protein